MGNRLISVLEMGKIMRTLGKMKIGQVFFTIPKKKDHLYPYVKLDEATLLSQYDSYNSLDDGLKNAKPLMGNKRWLYHLKSELFNIIKREFYDA